MQTSDVSSGYLINGIVEFSPYKRTLVRKDNLLTVKLHMPAAGCLVSLIEHHPDRVSQEDLIIAGWAELRGHVSPNTFYQTIMGLRQCLEEAGLNKDIIVTIRRKGLLLSPDVIIEPIYIPKAVSPMKLTQEGKNITSYEAGRTNGHQIKYFSGYVVVASVMLFVMIIILFLYKHDLLSVSVARTEYFSSYHYLQNYQKCHIFANNPLLSYSTYVKFIKDKNLSCDHRQWWYISSAANSPRMSVVRCINDVVSAKNNYCSCDYYSGRDSHD
ncbi:MAG: winged helix-turn-helix domain-containing protein [Hafnia sp.]